MTETPGDATVDLVAWALHCWSCPLCYTNGIKTAGDSNQDHVTNSDQAQAYFLIGALGLRPLPDVAEGNREQDSHDDPGEASPGSDAVQGDVHRTPGEWRDQQPTSPGADDPRIQYLYDELGYMLKKEALDELPAALDEVDRAAGIVRVDTRDEATIDLIARVLANSMQIDVHDDARAVLAALRDEQ